MQEFSFLLDGALVLEVLFLAELECKMVEMGRQQLEIFLHVYKFTVAKI